MNRSRRHGGARAPFRALFIPKEVTEWTFHRESQAFPPKRWAMGWPCSTPSAKQSYVLNATSALVFQHCDGQTSPEQLAEILRRKFNLRQAEAEQLTRLALEELETAQPAGVRAALPAAATFSRRQVLTTFATLGLSLALLPLVERVASAGGNSLIPLLECVRQQRERHLHGPLRVPEQRQQRHHPARRPQEHVRGRRQGSRAADRVQSGRAPLGVHRGVRRPGHPRSGCSRRTATSRHQVEASATSEACATRHAGAHYGPTCTTHYGTH